MSDSQPSILIVDDERMNINVLVELLKADYRTLVAKDGEQALKRAVSEPRPDLILLDVMMPEMDGHEVCRRLKADPVTADIPVIFVTAMSDSGNETTGFGLGAVDYITKPISPPVVKARVKTHLINLQARRFVEERNQLLEEMVAERTRELAVTQDVTILSMAALAETRDPETGNHIRRTQSYVRALAIALRDHPRFRDGLDEKSIELLYKSAPLHDIGKVGVPDHILLKPGKLTADEFEEMKQHPRIGRDAILAAEKALAASNIAPSTASFLRFAREIAYAHQEKWDGSGYPLGLKGDDIPLSARLMALADVYDALISRRVYKPAFSHEEAAGILRAGRGNHFDPDVVDAFDAIEDEFRAIAGRFAD
jgi:putative two-component system response regulator